jgi:hypothetical protein
VFVRRVAVPACGIEQVLDVLLPHSTLSREQQVVSAAAAAAATQFPAIHSDALAVLLGLVPLPESVWQLFSQQVSVCINSTRLYEGVDLSADACGAFPGEDGGLLGLVPLQIECCSSSVNR